MALSMPSRVSKKLLLQRRKKRLCNHQPCIASALLQLPRQRALEGRGGGNVN